MARISVKELNKALKKFKMKYNKNLEILNNIYMRLMWGELDFFATNLEDVYHYSTMYGKYDISLGLKEILLPGVNKISSEGERDRYYHPFIDFISTLEKTNCEEIEFDFINSETVPHLVSDLLIKVYENAGDKKVFSTAKFNVKNNIEEFPLNFCLAIK